MFFFFSIYPQTKELETIQKECPHCKILTTFILYQTSMTFSLFGLPLFHWNKKMYAKATCCGQVYEIIQGEWVPILNGNCARVCPHCGREVEDTYTYCPYCGGRL